MSQLFQVLGGLGVFLLGVVIMTGGLRGVAGDMLRTALTSFTRSPASGAVTGAVSTAILQSSSATTVAVVGFVGAGLLTFPQALGVIFGANIGTTITGWLVALLGFKLKLGTLVLPLVLVGVLMRLFGRGRLAEGGTALAGFSLIFVGIDAMQGGMSGLEGRVTPDSFPANDLLGRLQLLLIGVFVTLVTQSSSAGVAAALTAVHTGTIGLEQAAAMVIGMDIGTTATAALATVGTSTESRRTGFSHVIYNFITGAAAFLLLTPYFAFWQWFAPQMLTSNAEIVLVAFHTFFNALSILLILPFAQPFAALMYRLVPARKDPLVQRLDKHLLKEPAVALEALRVTLDDLAAAIFRYGEALLGHQRDANAERAQELTDALEQTQTYLDQIHLSVDQKREWQFLMACIHALDHLQRLHYRHERLLALHDWRDAPALDKDLQTLSVLYSELVPAAAAGKWSIVIDTAASAAGGTRERAQVLREDIMGRIARGELDTVQGDDQLAVARWIIRASHHLYRITHHLNAAAKISYKPTG